MSGVYKQDAKHSPFLAACAVHDIEFTIGAEGAGRTISLQAKDANGNNVAQRVAMLAWLSDDAAGESVNAANPSGGVAGGTDGAVHALVTSKQFRLVTEADGTVDVVITEAGADTWYLAVQMPDGRIVVSDAIEFNA